MIIIRFVGGFFAAQWRQYTPTGQLLFVLALVALAVDAGIAYEYGSSMTTLHAYGFALVAIGFCLLPDICAQEIRKGSYMSAILIGAVCVPLGATAYQSHIGYGAGVRLGDMQQTAIQAARYEGAQEAVIEDKTNLAMWRKQYADLIAANAWSTSVRADGLRAQIDSAQKAIDLESARGGCKSKCLALMESKAALKNRIAIAEQVSDLSKRIDATQRVIDGKRKVATTTVLKSSAVVHQNDALGQLWTLVSGHKVAATTVNLAATGNGALAFMLMAPVFMLAAGLNRRRRDDTDTDDKTRDVGETGNRTPEPRAYNPDPTVTLVRRANGDINRERLQALLANMPSRLEARAA